MRTLTFAGSHLNIPLRSSSNPQAASLTELDNICGQVATAFKAQVSVEKFDKHNYTTIYGADGLARLEFKPGSMANVTIEAHGKTDDHADDAFMSAMVQHGFDAGTFVPSKKNSRPFLIPRAIDNWFIK